MIKGLNVQIGLGKERNYFVENLSMLVSSGMTVLGAIDSISEEVKNPGMKKILQSLREDVENGSPLWKAFERTGIFPLHTVSLIRIGEESGNLAQNLKLIAIQEEKDRVFKSKIRGAMMYPGFVFSLTIIVGVLIMWFILPRLSVVFGQLKIELPAITKALIATGKFLGAYGVVAVPLFFAFIGLLVFFIFYYKRTKFLGQSFLFAFPGIGKLLREVELTRFGYLLGTLLEAGIPVVTALESLEKATTFYRYQKFYAHLKESVRDGNSFGKSFLLFNKSDDYIPKTIQGLIVAGEKSGSLSSTMLKFSSRYEAKIEDTTKNLSVIFEPILLVIVWVGVVAVALAVILPIYSLIGGINK